MKDLRILHFCTCAILLLSSCSNRKVITVINSHGQAIHKAQVAPQPISLFGGGNQTDENGQVTVIKIDEVEKYEVSKSGYMNKIITFDEIANGSKVRMNLLPSQ